MDIITLVKIGVILFFSSAIQGAVGFAFNVFAIPLLVLSSLSLPAAITLTSIPIFMQSLTSTYKLRKYIVAKDIVVGTTLRYLGLPVGIYILHLLYDLDKNRIKQFIGIVVLVVIAVQSFTKVKKSEKVSFFWTFTAFFSSGVALGAVAIGGPPVILWVMAQNWSALRVRAFLSALFFAASPVLLALLYFNFGDTLLKYFIVGLCFTPVVVAGTLFGVKIGNRLDEKKLKRIITALLIATSLFSIFSPYL